VRLRYEIRRQVAPYVGINWNRLTGATGDLARAAGDSTRDGSIVAGIRVWF
jgi:copper resistance protein B